MNLTELHKELLREIGANGMPPERLLRLGREFRDLEQLGLVVFWRDGSMRPADIFGGAAPGRWYLTFAGAREIGDDLPPLRLS